MDKKKTTNKALLDAQKKCVHEAKGGWVEELPGGLWAYCTYQEAPNRGDPILSSV